MNRRPWAAFAWLGLLLALGISIPFRVKHQGGFESSALALLPDSTRDARVLGAVKQVAGAATRKLILLCGSPNFEVSAKAADAAAAELSNAGDQIKVVSRVDADAALKAIEFYRPFRLGLLNDSHRTALVAGGEDLLQSALTSLYQPLGPPRLLPLEEDPLGLASGWLLEKASQNAFSLQAGRLTLEKDGQIFVAVLGELKEEGLSLSAQQQLGPRLKAAADAARREGAIDLIRGGFIFHAAEAAAKASREVTTIGLGSLLGVILLMMLPFRSPKPMLLVLLPIAVGSLFGLGCSVWAFDKVHLITLVFGSSIVGVAEDYGVHFVCGALEKKAWDPWQHLKNIRRGLFLALLTTLLGYAVLGAMPFPGLRQMGLFAVTGITAGWVTAVLWLPLLAKSMPPPRANRLLDGVLGMERRWPGLKSKTLMISLGLLLALSGFGLSRAKASDDVKRLYESSPELAHEEARLREMLRLPGGGQFFLLQGVNDEELLWREEALKKKLSEAKADGRISGWQALSDIVPSESRQLSDQALQQARVYGKNGLATRLFQALEEPDAARRSVALAKKSAAPMPLQTWLKSPVSLPYQALYLSSAPPASALLLSGSGQGLENLAEGMQGVSFVDHAGGISTMLKSFRVHMTWLILCGYALVAGLLFWMDKKTWWRIMAPPALASLFALGLPPLWGDPYSLFDALGLVLVLGMGIDYGIFMNEPRESSFKAAFLSVTLGAVSTLLSFGLLSLSGTPALSSFGTTVLLGIGLSWLLTPSFSSNRLEMDHEQAA